MTASILVSGIPRYSLCASWPKIYFGENNMLPRVELEASPLFCGMDLCVPLYGHVQLCKAAGMWRIQAVIRWTLTHQSPSQPGAACSRARRPAYLRSLPRQLYPKLPAPFQCSWGQLEHSAWGRSQTVFFLSSFLIPKVFSSKLGLQLQCPTTGKQTMKSKN